MDEKRKYVSVIIPTYNGSETIGRALESLKNQSMKNFEVVIVDDNGVGTKEQLATENVISKYKKALNIKYIAHKRNNNGAAARNTGIHESEGEYICFLDDDDIYLEDRIKNALHKIEYTKCDFVFCNVIIQRNGQLVGIVKTEIYDDIQKALLLNTGLFGTGSNIFVRKKICVEIKGFNEEYYRRQDNEFLLRALEKCTYCVIDSIDIVKINNGINNIPSYEKLISSNKRYFQDFKYLIEKLSKKETNKFFASQYSWIYFCCLMKNDTSNSKKVLLKLKSYRRLTLTEQFQTFLTKIRFNTVSGLQLLQPFMSKGKSLIKKRRLLNQLDNHVIEQLKRFEILT